MESTAREWLDLGEHRELAGQRVFTLVAPPLGPETAEPLLVLHGYPTSSLDYRGVLDGLRRNRRVLLFDMLGYGFSAKPDREYTMALQADLAQAFVADVGVERLALLSHDMGNTVGGELLARHGEGRWPVDVGRRVVTNGSIYIEMAHLTAGQELLLSLPDELVDPALAPDATALHAALVATFSPHAEVAGAEVRAQVDAIRYADGHRVLARTIRYIEERRRAQGRFTGAIEGHASPVGIVWGLDDPIAVAEMADRLHGVRPEAPIARLDRVGHYPMVEAPERYLAAVLPMLADPD